MNPATDASTAKAERLTQLRKLAKLSRKDIAQIAGVSVLTYKGWENAKFGGIPQKRAVLLVEIFQAEGIKSSVDWLMEGVGEPPRKVLCYQIAQLKEAVTDLAAQSPESVEQLRVKAELEFFCNNNNWETLSLVVPDDAMEPCFLKDDLVAGATIPAENFVEAIGMSCLVRTKNNKVLLRQIQKSNTQGLFTLLSLNPNSSQQLIIHDAELIDIAPVIWLRRKTILSIKTPHKG